MRRTLFKMTTRFAYAVIIASMVFVALPAAHAGQDAQIVKNLPSDLQLVDFSYFLDDGCKIQKGPCLTFKITLKNTGKKSQRYITRITLPDEGKSVGGFVPVKGKKDKTTGKKLPPVVEPGEEASASYPMLYSQMPSKIELEISLYE